MVTNDTGRAALCENEEGLPAAAVLTAEVPTAGLGVGPAPPTVST